MKTMISSQLLRVAEMIKDIDKSFLKCRTAQQAIKQIYDKINNLTEGTFNQSDSYNSLHIIIASLQELNIGCTYKEGKETE